MLLLQVAFHWRSALRHEPGLPHAFHAAPNAMAPDELSAMDITFRSPFSSLGSVYRPICEHQNVRRAHDT